MKLTETKDGKITAAIPFFQAPNEIFDKGFKWYELLVYLYLIRCANHGGTAFPSYQKIADKCGISRSTAKRAVQELVYRGYVEKIERLNQDTGQNFSNVYKIHL